MGKSAFSNLFSEIMIGNMKLRNRIAMSPMGTSLCTEAGLVNERVKAYYAERAKGGAGMVIVENASVDLYRCMRSTNRLAIDSDIALPGLSELARTIKSHGAKAAIQISHTGRHASSKAGGFQPVAPSPIALVGGEVPRPLRIDEIHEIVELFARAITRAKEAGFDGVEIHAAHQYLINQFFSSFSNKREDSYGGSLENRARILVEILTESRKLVGADYPIWCRINGQEFQAPGGLTLEESQNIARKLNGLVDALHVSAYNYDGHDSFDIPGALLPLAAAIKKVVTVPVFAVGRLTPELAEQAIKDGTADVIVMGRGLIADPYLPRKLSTGKAEDVKPCITCGYCTENQIKNNLIGCAVNGSAGQEHEFKMRPAKQVKKVAIIGGGPAGMEAARVLTLRGHQVILFEKEACLGGQLNLAIVPPHKKERIAPLLMWFQNQLDKLKVEIYLNTEVNTDVIKDLKPHIVILATGAIPLIPQLPGIEQRNVVTSFDLLAGRAMVGNKTVIIGGGAIGCETAEFLYEKGKQVTIVEMLPELATDMGANDRFRILNRITSSPIVFMTKTMCRAIVSEGLIIEDGKEERKLTADTVVLSAGTKPNNSLFPLLRAAGLDTRMAGDCWHMGRIAKAVSDGFKLGCTV